MTQLTITRDPSSLFRPNRPTHRRGGSLTVTRLILVTIVAAITFQAGQVQGQIINWNNPTGTNAWFENPLNWTPNAIPGPGSALSFNLGSTYHVFWNPNTSTVSPTIHTMVVYGGGNVTFSNLNSAQQYQLESLGGIGPAGNFNPVTVQGSTLTLNGLHLLAQGHVIIDKGFNNQDGVLNVNGAHPAGSRLTVGGSGRLDVDGGSMNVTGANAVVTSVTGRIGDQSSSRATVSGAGARWENSGNLYLGHWFNSTTGTLDVLAGGVVTSTDTILGEDVGPFSTSRGVVTVSGSGSWLDSSSDVVVGNEGIGTLNVADGGLITCTSGVIGYQATGSGAATVTGDDSRWLISDLLIVGGDGSATLDILDGGRVSVGSGGTTSIGLGGLVRISGEYSRFEFGQTTMSELQHVVGTGGSLAGVVENSGYTAASDFTTSISSGVNLDEVRLVNSGTIYGDAAIRFGLENTASGEVETSAGDRMRFAGSGNTNAGEINNFGGQIRFDQYLTNQYGGMVAGRGQFIADGGWSNSGVMAFSGGFADIVGDVYNQEGATIVTSGNGTTTFYDDFAQENGGSVRTSAGSSTVFFGEVSGGGAFVGDGTVFLEGDLRPGNSPGTMSFGGDLVLSSSASTMIELGGLGLADFDRLLIGGDLFLGDSSLEVALWDGFELGNGMQFLFADVEGDLFGQFDGLGEGSLVGNFGGTDLFITYNGFGGNGGVGLFTSAIPEPSALVLLGMTGLLGLISNRRRKA